MKSRIAVLLLVLILASIACMSTATPNPPAAVSLEDQVLTAAAAIELTKNSQAPLLSTPQPTQPAIPTETINPPTAQSQEIIGKVGETVRQDGYVITLVNIETAQQYGDFFQAASGNKLIAVELLFESEASTGVSVNPFYITIKDGAGYEYSSNIFGKEPTLQSQNDLPIGELMRGWVTFEIPETATGLVLVYEPITFLDDVRIRFDLGQ